MTAPARPRLENRDSGLRSMAATDIPVAVNFGFGAVFELSLFQRASFPRQQKVGIQRLGKFIQIQRPIRVGVSRVDQRVDA